MSEADQPSGASWSLPKLTGPGQLSGAGVRRLLAPAAEPRRRNIKWTDYYKGLC